MKRIALVAAAAALLPTTADAATNPYTPREVCGSAFRIIDSQVIATPTRRLGRTYLLYNPGTGFNCVVTLKSYGVGSPSPVSAMLQRQGGPQRMDSGSFKYYAGPRKVKAPGTCVRWGGGITVGRHSAGFDTDYEHCG
jgi:hypothetical protein